MRYWWVNHKQTYRHEVQGGFLWSPLTNKNGGRNHFYDNMTLVAPGDLVISFAGGEVRAVGIATDRAQNAQRPDFGAIGDQWAHNGWFLPVEFQTLANAVRPKDFITELLPLLPEKYAPMNRFGNGNQGAYLSEISEGTASLVLSKGRLSILEVLGSDASDEVEDAQEEAAEGAVSGRTDIGETTKKQLISARRGQGVFKANVRLNEKTCRVTGVAKSWLLIASHIKPWKDSDDREKLDGCNGLLLAPHVDKLFDKGLISFEDNGDLICSPQLDKSVLQAWAIPVDLNVGPFTADQAVYLAYHRKHRLKA